jgi:hypothetical protein
MYCFYMLIGTFYGMFLIVKYLKVFYGVTFYGPQTFIYIFIDVVVKVFARPYHKHLQNLHSLSVLRSLFMFSGFKCFFTLVLVARHNTQFPMALRKTYPINSLWRWIRIKSFLKMLGNMPYHASDDIASVINIKYVMHTILTNAIMIISSQM